MAMLKYLARTVRLLSAHVDDMAFRPAEWRVAQYLLSAASGQDQVSCTQEEIASSISVSRVTVSRILNQFSRRGWSLWDTGAFLFGPQDSGNALHTLKLERRISDAPPSFLGL